MTTLNHGYSIVVVDGAETLVRFAGYPGEYVAAICGHGRTFSTAIEAYSQLVDESEQADASERLCPQM